MLKSLFCRTFRDIASMEGHKSQERKRELISKLLTSSKDNETGYIMRALQVGSAPSRRCWDNLKLLCNILIEPGV